ncbi:MAG: T9SS type A sorting domain-containing protein, partial [Ignavibacteriaceae bacterium]|nr:T9SS type A sorting domain-containing protein [Ignavibacteriaceae bacterium]
ATPVELTSFSANAIKGAVNLSWKTATEVNNMGFNVERSANQTDWSKLAFVKGNGTTTSTISYSYVDNSVSQGNYYYRLKQIDNNGSFKYSSIVEVNVNNAPSAFALNQNYPNPFNPSTIISYSLPQASNVKLIVYNAIGQPVRTLENGFKNAGTYNVTFNASELSSGIYFCKIEAGQFSSIRKMMLVK